MKLTSDIKWAIDAVSYDHAMAKELIERNESTIKDKDMKELLQWAKSYIGKDKKVCRDILGDVLTMIGVEDVPKSQPRQRQLRRRSS